MRMAAQLEKERKWQQELAREIARERLAGECLPDPVDLILEEVRHNAKTEAHRSRPRIRRK